MDSTELQEIPNVTFAVKDIPINGAWILIHWNNFICAFWVHAHGHIRVMATYTSGNFSLRFNCFFTLHRLFLVFLSSSRDVLSKKSR